MTFSAGRTHFPLIGCCLVASACDGRTTTTALPPIIEVRLPQRNDAYMPRNAQLVLKIERAFVTSTGDSWPRDHPVNAIGFVAHAEPFRAADPSETQGDLIKVQLEVDPTDVVSASFDPTNSRYLPHPYRDSPRIASDVEGMVARRKYVVDGMPTTPFHELFTDLPGDTYADCEDPNNGYPAWCAMTIVHHGIKRIGVGNRFSLVVNIGLPRSLMPRWRKIRSDVLAFTAARAVLVPFGPSLDRPGD